MLLDLSAGNRNREVLQLIVIKKYIYRKENQYSVIISNVGSISPPLAVILDKMVLLYFWHRSNVSFDPVGGLLDLDVDQRGISGACWHVGEENGGIAEERRCFEGQCSHSRDDRSFLGSLLKAKTCPGRLQMSLHVSF